MLNEQGLWTTTTVRDIKPETPILAQTEKCSYYTGFPFGGIRTWGGWVTQDKNPMEFLFAAGKTRRKAHKPLKILSLQYEYAQPKKRKIVTTEQRKEIGTS